MIALKGFKNSFLTEKTEVFNVIQNNLRNSIPQYVSIVDSVVLNRAMSDISYLELLESFNHLICDSSLIIFLYNLKYKKSLTGYNGPDLFINLIPQREYSQLLIGTTNEIFKKIKDKSENENLFYIDIGFKENYLDFNYEIIEKYIIDNNINILWVMLGNPKQDYFAKRLKERDNINSVVFTAGAAYLFFLNEISNSSFRVKGLKILWINRITQDPIRQLKRSMKTLLNIFNFFRLIQK